MSTCSRALFFSVSVLSELMFVNGEPDARR